MAGFTSGTFFVEIRNLQYLLFETQHAAILVLKGSNSRLH